MPAMNLQRDENWARVIECQFSGSQRIFLNLFSVEHLGGEKIVSNDMLMESLQKCCPPCSGNRYFHSAYFYLYDSVSSWKLASQDQYSKNLASMDDEIISWFIQAVIKSHHRLGDLYNRNWFLIVLEAGNLRSRCPHGELSFHFLLADFSLCPQVAKGVEGPGSLFCKHPDLTMAPSSWPNHLPQTPSPNTTILGTVLLCEFGGDINPDRTFSMMSHLTTSLVIVSRYTHLLALTKYNQHHFMSNLHVLFLLAEISFH